MYIPTIFGQNNIERLTYTYLHKLYSLDISKIIAGKAHQVSGEWV